MHSNDDRWIARGAFEINLARRIVRHAGCSFRIVDEPPCALWIDTEGAPPPLDQVPTMQSRAWVVFYMTEKTEAQLREMKHRRGRD
jgi:hypothetical protein